MAKIRPQQGFTLVELIVSIGLFSIFMLLIIGSLLAMLDASRKARATRLAIDNISSAVDYISREVRLGAYFRCENDMAVDEGNIMTPQDCRYIDGGGILLAFEGAGGSLVDTTNQTVFRLNTTDPAHQSIEVSTDSGRNYLPLTDSSIHIQSLRFYLDGSNYSVASGDANQPRITVLIRGIAGANKVETQVSFTLQTTLTARSPNIPPS